MMPVTLKVNGLDVRRTVAPRMHLADFVREELHLTGTHIGCEHGVCGSCTLMLDGRPVRSCLTYAVACAGSDVRTIEAFDDDPVMALLRDAFSRHHGLQCGYCTPGMLATAYDIVTRLPEADEARVREELAGNLCRCTGYVGIVAAIRDVLACGPHRSAMLTAILALPPSAPAAIDLRAAAGAAEPAAVACAAPDSDLEGGVTLVRSVMVEMEPSRLWALLEDIETVARCLPGADLESVAPDGAVAGAFEVAIGPIRTRFRGAAQVVYDHEARRGEVRGGGGDGASRSRAEGQIRFAVRQREAGAALDLAIVYKLGGPLAQFGRPAIVAAVADQLLADFSANLVAAAKGEQPARPATLHAFRLLLDVLSALLRRALSRG